MNKLLLISLLVLSLFLLVSCNQQASERFETDTSDEKSELTGETVVIEMIAKNWEFVPSTIRVNLGDRVELHIESVEGTHGFMLPEFGVNERLEPGNDVHVNFVADKKGTFTFACNVPCGSGHGSMRGRLIVS